MYLDTNFFCQSLDPLGTVGDKHNPRKPDLLEKSNHLEGPSWWLVFVDVRNIITDDTINMILLVSG